MAVEFRKLAENYWVAPQLGAEDIVRAAAAGAAVVINNRPDAEEPGQPTAAEIGAAAARSNLRYFHIPVGPAGVSEAELDQFDAAAADGAVILAFCRSGTRSTMLRALAHARAGRNPAEIVKEAATVGYDLSAMAPRLAALFDNRMVRTRA